MRVKKKEKQIFITNDKHIKLIFGFLSVFGEYTLIVIAAVFNYSLI